MAKISDELREKVLSIYKPEQRILLEASLEYPIMTGSFLIGNTYYVIKPFQHATDIEIQLCLNQLIYVGIAETIRLELVPELKGLNFYELQKESMFIIESRKRFRKPIPTNKEICGQIELERFKDFGYLLLSQADFQFENKSCFGNLELALVKPNPQA